jgi:hypothetical protein
VASFYNSETITADIYQSCHILLKGFIIRGHTMKSQMFYPSAVVADLSKYFSVGLAEAIKTFRYKFYCI